MAKARQSYFRWLLSGKFVVPIAAFGLASLGWSLTRVHSVSASDPGANWPMWGGHPDRNMVSNMKGLPVHWDVAKKQNVKWVATLGSQTYGNPVVADGKVFVGRKVEGIRGSKQSGERGVRIAV